jgi:hypothetical protein
MAILNLYLTNNIVDGWQELSQDVPDTSGALTSPATGWIVGKIASGNYASLASGVERTTAGFTGTVQPDGSLDNTLEDALRAGPFTGSFASGTWNINPVMQSNTAVTSSNAVILRFRVFKSPNIDGSSATEITSEPILVPSSGGYSLTPINTAVSQSTNWATGSIDLDNEYLFFQTACYINAASGSNGSDVLFRTGSSTGTVITTADFIAANRDVSVTAVLASSSVENLSTDMSTSTELTSVSSSIMVGSITRSASVNVSITSTSTTSSTGALSRNMSTGRSLTGVLGSLSTASYASATSVASVNVSGNTISSTVGNVSNPTIRVTNSGITSSAQLGILSPGIAKTLTSTSVLGTIGSIPLVTIGRTLQSVTGTVSPRSLTVGTAKIISITGTSGNASIRSINNISINVSVEGITANTWISNAQGSNYKQVGLTSTLSYAVVGSFAHVLSSISLGSVTARTKISRFKFWSPSTNVFSVLREVPVLDVLREVHVFTPVSKYYVFAAPIRYKLLTTDRKREFLSSRSNYYNQG